MIKPRKHLVLEESRVLRWRTVESRTERDAQIRFMGQRFSHALTRRGRHSQHPSPGVNLKGEESEIRRFSILIGNFNDHSESGLQDALLRFVGDISSFLIMGDTPFFEVLGVGDDPNLVTLRRAYLRRAWRLPYGYFQIAPRSQVDEGERTWSWIPKKIPKIGFPGVLGGKYSHQFHLWIFSAAGTGMPRFNENKSALELDGFDFSVAKLQSMQLRLRGMNKVGYLGDSDLSDLTEAYLVYRDLTSKWAQAVLRDHVLDWLRAVCKKMKISITIDASGLTDANEFVLMRDEVLAGTKTFSEAFQLR